MSNQTRVIRVSAGTTAPSGVGYHPAYIKVSDGTCFGDRNIDISDLQYAYIVGNFKPNDSYGILNYIGIQ